MQWLRVPALRAGVPGAQAVNPSDRRIDVVIPVYNEERDLGPSVTKLREFLLSNKGIDLMDIYASPASSVCAKTSRRARPTTR